MCYQIRKNWHAAGFYGHFAEYLTSSNQHRESRLYLLDRSANILGQLFFKPQGHARTFLPSALLRKTNISLFIGTTSPLYASGKNHPA
jgi:hypothetical protein